MKTKAQVTYEPHIKLNSHGQPDCDYYFAEAKRMRAQMLREMFQGAADGVRRLLERAHLFPLHFSSTAHH